MAEMAGRSGCVRSFALYRECTLFVFRYQLEVCLDVLLLLAVSSMPSTSGTTLARRQYFVLPRA